MDPVLSPVGKHQVVLHLLHQQLWSFSAPTFGTQRENLVWTLAVRKHDQDNTIVAELPTGVCTNPVALHGTILSPPSNVRQGNSFFFKAELFFKIYFIEVQLIYNVVLISAVQQNDSVIPIQLSPLHMKFQAVNFQRCERACQPLSASCCTVLVYFSRYCTVRFKMFIFVFFLMYILFV